MTRHGLRIWGFVCLGAAVCAGAPAAVLGASLDANGEISLGVRTYTSARVGTEHTDISIKESAGRQVRRSLTFPVSPDGHLRQNRFYAEVELDHDLKRLVNEGFGPFGLLNDLPFKFKKLKYHIVYRGEAEGIYDYGPSEYRTAEQFYDTDLATCFSGSCPDVSGERRRLRRLGVQRQRLFQAYVEAQAGELLIRLGRQILVWGETDTFRLLDNINPIDSSFGGFLTSLDERRVPLDMLVANYYFGDVGPFYESYVEAFGAIDDAVGFTPGIPTGSPWSLPNFEPSVILKSYQKTPTRTFTDIRGGIQIKANALLPGLGDATFGFAHYYTYFDTPAVQTFTSRSFPLGLTTAQGTFLAIAEQTAPRVQVTGATMTFALPSEIARHAGLSGEPIFRSELAYFQGEPRFSQANLDPFVYATGGCNGPGHKIEDGVCTGGKREGDSWNFVLGVDINQWIRFLNPNQTFFITTQFFYKHLNGAVDRGPITNRPGCKPGVDGCVVIANNGEVLPVPEYKVEPALIPSGASQSILIHNPVDQYLQTLLIATQYYSGQIQPSFTFIYDWSGSLAAVPAVTFSRDPFRFTMAYNYLYASRYKGASGVSLLRDRDNLLFQLEYVI